MLVYNDVKRQFVLDVKDNSIADKILEAISPDDKSSGIRNSTTPYDTARRLILNTYKTLLTRGQKGCYVYCEDEPLREYLKRCCGQK